ncbi:hypothetical protein K2Q16_01620 [Patescibacteria group bacterium]|nr:hypothetical protein [Patescibacteria group bacterium]
MKKFIAGLTLAAVMATGFATASPAEAASSLNGFYHSNGKSANSWKNNNHNYSYTTSYQQSTIDAYIRQIETLLAQLRALQGGNYYSPTNYGMSEVHVTTRSADAIEDDAATLRGVVDFNDSDEATVYFRWGISAANLYEETAQIVLDEGDDENFDARIDDLDEDRTYYYRAIAEDEDGRRVQGAILSFRSDDDGGRDDHDDNNDNDGDWPQVETGDASDIGDNYAELEGEVDMNDYEDGYVFLVYGEYEDQIDDVANAYDSYEDVNEDGDDLQKIAVDSSLDDSSDYWVEVSGLDEDTDIFYAYCVAFEDEDDDEQLVCGDTQSFTTEEN